MNRYDIYVKTRASDADECEFDVRFHDGYEKIFTITSLDCMEQRASARDVLEVKVTDFYEEMIDEPFSLNFIFW